MKGIRFRPEQDGLRAALFDLEADIMEAVWTRGWHEFAVADVKAELERSRDIAYTTVMTTVARLHEKGLLDRVREGRRFVYRPVMDRAQFSDAMAQELLGSLSGIDAGQAMAFLVGRIAESDRPELKRLEALIRKRKKALER